MAAVLTQSNSFKLTARSAAARPSRIYMAHFMGVGRRGQADLECEDTRRPPARELFPNAARRTVRFLDRSGRAPQRLEVYSVLTSRYAVPPIPPATRTAMASVAARPRAWRSPARHRLLRRSTIRLSVEFPDVQSVTPSPCGHVVNDKRSPPTDPIFRSWSRAANELSRSRPRFG